MIRYREAFFYGIFGDQTGAQHDRRIGCIRTGRYGGNDDMTVTQLCRLAINKDFTRFCLLGSRLGSGGAAARFVVKLRDMFYVGIPFVFASQNGVKIAF